MNDIDGKNQALKLLLVTFNVNLVAALDFWAKGCSSVILSDTRVMV